MHTRICILPASKLFICVLDRDYAKAYLTAMDIPNTVAHPAGQELETAGSRRRCWSVSADRGPLGIRKGHSAGRELFEAHGAARRGRGRSALDAARPVRTQIVPTPIPGKASAGVFQEIDDFENQDATEVLVARDPRFPHARIVVFDVDGNSMNAFDPPIPDGSRVSGPAFEDIREVPRNGMAVVIQRSTADGQMLEWSVKEIEVREDGYTFHPPLHGCSL